MKKWLRRVGALLVLTLMLMQLILPAAALAEPAAEPSTAPTLEASASPLPEENYEKPDIMFYLIIAVALFGVVGSGIIMVKEIKKGNSL